MRKISILLVVLLVFYGFLSALPVRAAALTSVSDNMTTLAQGATADHTITWTLPTGVTFAAADQARVDFPANFTASAAAGWAASDFTFNDGTSRSIVAVGASPSCSNGANNVTVAIDDTNDHFTITACTGYSASASAATVTFTIAGTAANGTLTNPASAETSVISITGDNKGDGFDSSNDDTASIAVAIIADDSVNVTANVDPTISFAISDTTIGFGTLTTANVRYATGDTNGTTSETSAHNLTASTNAASGYTVYVRGATLTSGGNSITAIGGSATASSAGNEQFGIKVSASGGNGAAVSPYNTANYAYNATSSTQDDIATSATSSATTTYSITYIANIHATTEAGSYTTDLTYTATGTF